LKRSSVLVVSQSGIDFPPVSGEKVQELVAEMYRTPPEILAKALEVYADKKKR